MSLDVYHLMIAMLDFPQMSSDGEVSEKQNLPEPRGSPDTKFERETSNERRAAASLFAICSKLRHSAQLLKNKVHYYRIRLCNREGL